MRPRNARRAVVTTLVLGVLAWSLTGWTAGSAGVAVPFFDQPEALRHAFGTESAAVRLAAAATLSGDDAFGAVAALLEDAREAYLPLFAASLEARDPDLARRLSNALDQAGAAAQEEDGAGLRDALRDAQARVLEARARLVSQGLLNDPGFAAALAFTLLLWEGGVAEGFEEAVEEGGEEEYLMGRAALQHVEALWQEVIRPGARAGETIEIEELLDRLQALFGVPEPARALAYDPEEGETWAQYLVGSLERLTGAELYPDRDPGRLTSFLHAQSQEACTSLEDAGRGTGREGLLWVGILYEEHLSALVGLFSPAASRSVEQALEALAEGGSAGGEQGCRALLAGLDEITSIFGG